MKPRLMIPLALLAVAGAWLLRAQTSNPPPSEALAATNSHPAAASASSAPAAPIAPTPPAPPPPASEPPSPPPAAPLNPDELRLNFRGAPLDTVLNYLSEAAGFIIVLEAQPRGKVDVLSNQPLTREEAVDLLNTVLAKNGYAAIRRGRTLTIVNKDEAKTKAIPVKMGSDPDQIPDNDEFVTQIIPVRFVEAGQLIKDLQPLVSPQTALTANESGNSIVITDTQANIRRVAEIVRAIDAGAEDVTEVRVFHLQYSDPNEMSDLLANLFPDDSRTGSSQSPVQFSSFRSRFFGGFGGSPGSSSAANNQNARVKKRNRVLAVPDPRTSSVVVTASKDLIDQIAAVVTELDSNPARKQTVRVFTLQNASPEEARQVLQDMFEKNTTANNRNTTQNVLQNRSQQQSQTSASAASRSRSGSSSRGRTVGR